MTFSFGQETFQPAFEAPGAAKVSYGLPFTEACRRHVQESFQCSRVFIIASTSLISHTTALDRLRKSLGSKVVGVRIGIKPHTPIDECLQIIQSVRQAQGDCLITLGAGSITDGAKLVRFGLANGVDMMQDFETLWGGQRTHNPNKRSNIQQETIPLICIPTSLSGGEYQAITGATDPFSHRKKGFEPINMPNLVVLDPELCTTTPPSVWLSTGVRSIDHCVETLCALQCDPYAEQKATMGLKRLVSGLLETHSNPSSLDARLNSQLGVIDAMGSRTTGVPLGASHGIGHQLGPFGVSHGVTSCIMLPAVCKYNFNRGANISQQNKIAQMLRSDPQVLQVLESGQRKSASVTLADILGYIIDELELPRTLKDVNIGRDQLQKLAEHSLDDPWMKKNPIPISTTEQVLEILEMVVE